MGTKRLAAVAVIAVFGFLPLAGGTPAGAVDSPLSVSAFSGFNAELARAPYVTDLAQTTAYVNWATTVGTLGSVKWAAVGSGGCPSSVLSWSSSATGASTSLPAAIVNGSATTPPASMASWSYSVVNGAGTTVSEYQDSVELTGLTAGTTYCYAVFSSDSSGAVDLLSASQPDQSFTTLSTPSTTSTKSVTFDVMGDTGENYLDTGDVEFPGQSPSNPTDPDEASLYNQIGSSGAQFLLMAGDVSYSGGTQSTYGDLQQTGTDPEVSNIFGPTYFPQTGGIPTFVADGNHGQNVTTLRVWPSPVTAATSGGTYDYDSYAGVDGISSSAPDDWYAFTTGNVRIYVLDAAWADNTTGTATGSECATPSYCLSYQADADEHWQTSSPEYQWLRADLAAHPGGIKMAVFHYPLESDNATQTSDPYLQNQLQPLLAQNGVDIAFEGHAHTYQRFVPRQPGQVISYVTGGGGGFLEPVQGGTTCSAFQATDAVYALGWDSSGGSTCGGTAPGSAADVYNFLKVTVTGSKVVVSPTNAAGAVFDQQTYTFGGSTGSGTPSTPGFVSATATSSSSVQVSWTPSTESGGTIAYYDITRNGTALATGVTGTSFTDSSAVPGIEYTYKVTAYDTLGTASAAGSSNTLAVPTMAGAVTASASGPTTVQLHWSPSSEFKGSIASYQVDRNGVMLSSTPGTSTSFTDTTAVPGTTATYSVTAFDQLGGQSTPADSNPVTTPGGGTLPFTGAQTDCMKHLPAGSVVGAAALSDGSGYYEVDAQGDVAAFGAAVCHGAMTGTHLNKPIVGMAVDPATGGYWLVATDGGIFSFNAPFHGSTGAIRLNQPIVGMTATANGSGYWFVASDGGVFAFNAHFYGSTGNERLNKPIVGMAVDAATGGYWLVATDGGVFSFHAPFLGSTGAERLNKPIVGLAALSSGSGYRLIASDGGVFTFRAPYYGSTGSIRLNRPIIIGIDDPATNGYWLIASDGGVFTYRAPFYGSAA